MEKRARDLARIRVKENLGILPPQWPMQNLRDVLRDPVREAKSMAVIRELMDPFQRAQSPFN